MSARVAVLLYHHVGPVVHETCRGLTVPAEAFARQMSALAAMGYQTIQPAQWAGYVKGRNDIAANSVILTFDDGYADLVEHAFPILARHGFSATVFIPTSLVGSSIQCNKGVPESMLPIMTREQLLTAASAGIEFGAHSRTHADLSLLDPTGTVDEIEGSRNDLSALLGRSVTAFAYPYGVTTPTARKLAGDLFEAAFTTEPGLNDRTTPLNALRRTMVQHKDTVADVCLRAKFGSSVFERLRSAAGRVLAPLGSEDS